MSRYLTLAAASELTSVPAETLRYWAYTGKITAYRPGRALLIDADEIDTIIKAAAVGKLRAKQHHARFAQTAAARSPEARAKANETRKRSKRSKARAA